MRKIFLLTLVAMATHYNAFAQNFETATEAVSNMGLGWNLGNTLDANSQKQTTDVNNDAYWGCQGLESETCWGQYVTTQPLFSMMKNAGFGAIRVPVTWYNHMDKDGKVDATWMARVHEIVDWVLDAGLYCVINVHHDTGADSDSFKSWIKADMDTYNKQKDRYEYLWKQIAEEFKDYDQHLLFASYNEMLDIKSSWCYASFNTSSKYDATIAKSAYDAINSWAQSFVTTVRATGGNNSERNLICNTYGSCCGAGTWSSHLSEPLTEMKLPEDNVANHIIFEVHDYPSVSNTTWQSIKDGVDQTISSLKKNLASKGAPVIFGEWGTSNVDGGDGKTDYDLNKDMMFKFVDYFIKQTKENGMGTFYWMGLTDGVCRTVPQFNQADLAEHMAKAYHGDGFQGEYPEYKQPSVVECFNGEKVLNWGDGITVEGSLIKNASSQCQVELSYTQTASSGDDIQIFYGNWSAKPDFIVDGKVYSGDFGPSGVYGTGANTDHVTTLTFPTASYNQATQLGILIHGTGVTMKKIRVIDPSADGIAITTCTAPSSAIYNLSGQKVGNSYKGIVIIDGRKVVK